MILCESLPRGKAFLGLLRLTAQQAVFVTRFLLACLTGGPRLSAQAVGGCVRTGPRHAGDVCRFLRRLPRAVADDWLEAVYGNLLADEPPKGTWVFILDQTYCSHNSARMQNTYSNSPKGRRPKHGRKQKRHKRKQQPQHCCHCFVFGLLVTPTGLRLPLWRPYLTKEYCAATRRPFFKQAELAGQMVGSLRVPAGADVVVLGDAGLDASPVLAACQRRGFTFVVSMNHDRVPAGPGPGRKPRVTSRAAGGAADDYAPVRLVHGGRRYAAHRRAARRAGLRSKDRLFWVHAETLDVQNVGTARVLFSTMKGPVPGQAVAFQKALLTNDLGRPVDDLVELYDSRWQTELFFRECKSTLGLGRYRFEDFRCVESWVGLVVLAFSYLEWYRAQALRESAGRATEHARWRRQRSHGLCLAVRQDLDEQDLRALLELLQGPGGPDELRERLRRAIPKEYRKAS